MAQTKVSIPKAIQLVIDDVGWREGWSLAESGGPFRAGVNRLLGPQDYLAIAEIGKRLNMRPQAATVLCEWDQENICALCPTSTPKGTAWVNTHRKGDWVEKTAQIFLRNAAHLELALHGVGHEHWDSGVMTRAEWYFAHGHKRWPWPVLVQHLETYTKLLNQHGLGPQAGHRFPKAAVPCAFQYYFNGADPQSTGSLFSQAGVEFVSTPFHSGFTALGPLASKDGGFEHGLTVIDRGTNSVPWDAYNAIPKRLVENFICGIHWPNLLMPDPNQNETSIARWVSYLESHAANSEMMLAANSTECFTQWLCHRFVHLQQGQDEITLDGRYLPEQGIALLRKAPLWLKVRLSPAEHITATESSDLKLVAYQHTGEYGLLGFSGMVRRQTRLSLTLGTRPPNLVALRHSTANIRKVEQQADFVQVSAEVFGRQQIRLTVPKPVYAVHKETGNVVVERFEYHAITSEMTIDVAALDMQGAECLLLLPFRS